MRTPISAPRERTNAGSLFINLRDSVDKNIVEATTGSFDYERLFTMGSTKLGDGSLLYAGEVNTYNGPWTTPDDMRKLSGELRYSQGTATNGFSATALAYSNRWTSSDQIPLRAIESGQIGLYGELDPTDGGDTSRFSLSARMAQSDANGSWKANAYLVKYELDLFNNFTWYLTNPVYGDQSTSTTTASTAVVASPAPSRGRCLTCPPKPSTAFKPAMTTLILD